MDEMNFQEIGHDGENCVVLYDRLHPFEQEFDFSLQVKTHCRGISLDYRSMELLKS